MHFLTILALGLLTSFPVEFRVFPEVREERLAAPPGDPLPEPSRPEGTLSQDPPQGSGSMERTPSSVDVHNDISSSVLRVEVVVDGTGEVLGHGTGFFFSGDGLLMTNHHVISDALVNDHLGVRAVDVGGRTYEDLSVEYVSLYRDIAILRHKGGARHHLDLAREDARTGQTVYLYGNPGEGWQSTSFVFDRGMVNKVASLADREELYVSFQTSQRGSSGSPVVSERGEVVGILWGLSLDEKIDTVEGEEKHVIKDGSIMRVTGLASINRAIEEYEGLEQHADASKLCDANEAKCHLAGSYFLQKGNIEKAAEYFEKEMNLGSRLAQEKLWTIEDEYGGYYDYEMTTAFGSGLSATLGLLFFVLSAAFMTNVLTGNGGRSEEAKVTLVKRAVAYALDGAFNVLLVSSLYLATWLLFAELAHDTRQVLSTAVSLALSALVSFVFYSVFGGLPGKVMLRMRLVDAETKDPFPFLKYCVRENVLKPLAVMASPRALLSQYKGRKPLHDELLGTSVVGY